MDVLELKVPPVALVLALAAAMWFVPAAAPSLAFSLPWHAILAAVLAADGAAIAVAGVVAFRRARTTVDPTKPGAASSMVTSGIYRFSRNPMYVGFLLALAGWAVYLSHALPFAFLPAYVAYMNRFQITPEERALAAKFGAGFDDYRKAVRRWL